MGKLPHKYFRRIKEQFLAEAGMPFGCPSLSKKRVYVLGLEGKHVFAKLSTFIA